MTERFPVTMKDREAHGVCKANLIGKRNAWRKHVSHIHLHQDIHTHARTQSRLPKYMINTTVHVLIFLFLVRGHRPQKVSEEKVFSPP